VRAPRSSAKLGTSGTSGRRRSFENWQSEFLQLLAFVVFTSFLIFKGSPESRDGQDEMVAALERIERRLAEIEGPVKV
jgi:hypothetical protein